VHQYKDGPVDYNVELTVRDDDGEVDKTLLTVSIANRQPTADAGVDASTPAGTELSFDGTNSADKDGEVVTYAWDFGDGTTAAGATAKHTFTDDGLYYVFLKVSDDDGSKGVDYSIITVSNNKPTASFTVDSNSGFVTTVFEFQSTSADIDGEVVKLRWDFGDGTASTELTPSHQYKQDGIYLVYLTAIDDDGAQSDEFGMVIFINNLEPVADIKTAVTTAEAGDGVLFDGSGSYDPEGDELTYSWDFGDDSTGSDPVVKHQFMIPGNYRINLTVTDEHGNTAGREVTIDIDERTLHSKPIKDDSEGIIPVAVMVLVPICVLIVALIVWISSKKRPGVPEEKNEGES
jgi:PKD repeat protein